MKDFKKMPKMACGGGVKKYAEGKTVVKEEADIPRFRGKMYAEEPSMARKAGIVLEDAANSAHKTITDTLGTGSALRQPTIEGMKNPPNRKKRGGKIKK